LNAQLTGNLIGLAGEAFAPLDSASSSTTQGFVPIDDIQPDVPVDDGPIPPSIPVDPVQPDVPVDDGPIAEPPVDVEPVDPPPLPVDPVEPVEPSPLPVEPFHPRPRPVKPPTAGAPPKRRRKPKRCFVIED
jgi:hypothetical protein